MNIGAHAAQPTGAAAPPRPTFEVLLATCNGALFLPDLLDSLLGQQFADFTIVVRDDCSHDTTPAIIAEYAARSPGRFRLLASPPARTGACANFAALIAAAQADFIFLCDQDDVWLPEKMARTFAVMEQLIACHGADMPLMVHTDLSVVGPRLEVLGASFFRYAGIDPARNSLGELLLGNIATGCTMLINRPLCDLARPIPDYVLMYDHWLAQVSAAIGAIGFLAEPTVLYRQHGNNAVGVAPAGMKRFLRSIARTLLTDATHGVLCRYSGHASALLERYGLRLHPDQRSQLAALAGVWTLPRFRRFAHLLHAGLRKPSITGNIAMFLLLLLRNDSRSPPV